MMKKISSKVLSWPGLGIMAGLLLLLAGLAAFSFNSATTRSVPQASSATASTGQEEADNDGDAPKADGPQEYMEWYKDRQADQNGYIDPQGLLNAKAHVDTMRQIQPGSRVAGVGPGAWSWAGPGNIGGRIRSIVVDPNNTSTIYVGGVAGGIWKSTNGGASWTPLGDFLSNLAVASLAMDPTNSQVIYAGTGEGYFNADAIQGNGIFKSTDGGATWTQLSSTNNSNFYYVTRLDFSNNGSLMLAATSAGIFRSTDKGATWTKVSNDAYYQVKFNPADSTKAIAAGSYGIAGYSIDSGQTWTKLSAPGWQTGSFYNRVELAYAPSSSNIVYASTTNTSGFTSQLWKSVDGGQTYAQLAATGGSGTLYQQGWYANTLAVSPNDSNLILWSGLDIYRSTDGGANFTKISQWQAGPPIGSTSAHADHHITLFDPGYNGTTNTRVYFGNDGGIFKAENVLTVAQNTGWTNLNNGLGITQFYGGAGNASSGKIIAGAQDNGTVVYNGNPQSWSPTFGGDGGFVDADPSDPNYLYGEYVYLEIHRSTNGGNGSSYIYTGISDAGSSAAFIAPFILDPNTPSTMLAGGNDLWRSTNVKAASPTWAGLGLPKGSSCSRSSCISAIAVAKGNSDIIWTGRGNGSVYYTTNGTAASPTWNTVTLPAGVSGRSINSIAIDSNNTDVVYIALSGYRTDTLYKVTNSGATWTLITGSGATALPAVPIFSVAVFAGNSNWLYVGTPIGLFASADDGATWQVSPKDGPNNAPVNQLTWVGTNELLAVTHGRGVYTVNVSVCANSLLVNQTTDTNTCGTLRYALGQATSGATITLRPSGPIVVTAQLPAVPAGVTIQGICSNGPTVVIDGTGVAGRGLKLSGNNTITGIEVKGFNGPQIKVTPQTNGPNHLLCVVASKN